jgi:hypothetical protein
VAARIARCDGIASLLVLICDDLPPCTSKSDILGDSCAAGSIASGEMTLSRDVAAVSLVWAPIRVELDVEQRPQQGTKTAHGTSNHDYAWEEDVTEQRAVSEAQFEKRSMAGWACIRSARPRMVQQVLSLNTASLLHSFANGVGLSRQGCRGRGKVAATSRISRRVGGGVCVSNHSTRADVAAIQSIEHRLRPSILVIALC